MSDPKDPRLTSADELEIPVVSRLEEGPLQKGPLLVKVDRYGSVSGLIRVRVPLGMLVIIQDRSRVGPGSFS